MRFGTARLLVALVALTAVPSCGQDGSGAQTRVVPAPGVVLERAPKPDDRELLLRISLTSLSRDLDPIADVSVRQDATRIGVRVTVRERVPGADEDVSNNAFTRTRTVRLDQPVGTASVVDLNHEPPTEIKPLH
jgi:hypothetical protein